MFIVLTMHWHRGCGLLSVFSASYWHWLQLIWLYTMS